MLVLLLRLGIIITVQFIPSTMRVQIELAALLKIESYSKAFRPDCFGLSE